MASLVRSAVEFARGTWGAILAAFAAVTDPLDIAKMTGLVEPGTTWVLGADAMRGIFALCAFVWIFVWFHRQQTKFEEAHPEPDMPLHIACRWIARDSVWAKSVDPRFDDQWVELVRDEIMSKLRLGRIEMFGRRREVSQSKGALETVRSADKDRIQWDAHKLASPEPPTHCIIPGGTCYYNVMLNRQQVHRLWPSRSLWARVLKRSPIERLGGRGYGGLFDQQDEYYRVNGGFSPIPLKALLANA